MTPPDESSDTGTVIKKKERLKRPRQYKVILLNDDYTTMEFVVLVLEGVFLKSPSEAVRIMLQVHRQGRGMCGVFSREIAEAKTELVHQRAQEAGYPLRAVVEEE